MAGAVHRARDRGIVDVAPRRGIVGRYLLSLGHRRIAYVCPDHAPPWSRQRLAGLRNAYASAGLLEAVEAHTADRIRPVGDVQEVHAALDDAADRLIHAGRGRRRSGAETRVEMVDHLVSRALSVLDRERRYLAVETLLRPVIRQRQFSAMVAGNDIDAIGAVQYLSTQGIRVPHEVSVVGFDDEIETVARRVTSYNFNCAAIVRAMLESVLRPRRAAVRGVTRAGCAVPPAGAPHGRAG